MNISEGCQLDNNKYFEKFVDNYIFNRDHQEEGYWINGESFELIIRPECNQQCEYCYVARYGDKLYPMEKRADNKTLIHNTDIILNYIFKERKVLFHEMELFAGDLFYDDIGFEIFELMFKYYKELYDEHPNLFNNHPRIVMPNNFSFATNDKKAKRMEELLTRFKTINMEISLSCSVDGPYNSVRERDKDDSYYTKILEFLQRNPCGIHPMISPSNIESAIKNFDWWDEQYEKYNLAGEDIHDFQPMYLEVRNDEWTDEKLDHYLEFLTHMLEVRFHKNGESVDKLARHIFLGDGEEGSLPCLGNYDPLGLTSTWDSEEYTCAISHQTCFYVASFEFAPCHRTSYPQFLGGRLNVKDDKVVGVTAINPTVYSVIKMNNTHMNIGCPTCPFDPYCLKGCLGAQYEATGDLFVPGESVCKLHKTHLTFLAKTYCELGLTQIAVEKNYFKSEIDKEKWLTLCRQLGYYND